ncbi:MAG: chitobiase/beta-hexosaminidase C-terminal domain-containing protein [Clostridiales bacterium]|nr:chitobiase/beta-hexosaminidase C-terminal domain-containing protein [Clostridiales bacterium]
MAQQNFYNIFSNVNNNTSTTASTSEIDPGATNKFVTPIPATPTPKVVNPGDGTLTFSLDSGFYSTNQTLTISSKGDFPIYYTVNGDSPSVVQKPYNGNILLSCSGSTENVVVIRAAAFNGNKMLGNVITKTYILSASIDSRYSMPVISLVTDGGNLYNSQVGILAPNNISKKGRDWERPVNVTFFFFFFSVGFFQDLFI